MSLDPCALECEPCEGLGTKLKNISVSGSSGETPNECIEFETLDWVKDGKLFVYDIGPDIHNKGQCTMISVQEQISVSSWVSVGVEETFFVDGTIRLGVNCDPDCRFPGRVAIDG